MNQYGMFKAKAKKNSQVLNIVAVTIWTKNVKPEFLTIMETG